MEYRMDYSLDQGLPCTRGGVLWKQSMEGTGFHRTPQNTDVVRQLLALKPFDRRCQCIRRWVEAARSVHNQRQEGLLSGVGSAEHDYPRF